jgi:hypothetical protein
MVKSRRFYIFLEAFLVATFLFTFGILMGIFIENARVNILETNFASLEADILDARLISDLIGNAGCNISIQENINFADRVFYEANQLTKYENSNQITDTIRIEHKKYDLLRIMILENSINIKQKCNVSYHDVVYIYQYNNPTLSKKAEQGVISNLLSSVKEKYGNNVLLLSFAGDIDSPSVDLFKTQYNITQLPTILIDENVKITDVKSIDDIEKYLV